MSEMCDTLVLREALWPPLFALQLCGYWAPENASTFAKQVYRNYAISMVAFFFVLYFTSECVNVVVSRHDLQKVIEASLLVATHGAQAIKLYQFVSKHERLVALANSLQDKKLRARDEQQYRILTRVIFVTQTTYYVFMLLALATCTTWAIFPIFERAEDGSIGLPLPAYYPFSTNGSPIFQIIFVYQIAATFINGAANVSMDVTLSTFMALMGSQLDLLNDTLMRTRELALAGMGRRAGELDGKGDEQTHPELEAEMNRILVECVQQHWMILDCTNEIGELFNIGVLSQFIAGSSIICIILFQMTTVNFYSIQFVSYILYQGCMVTELFLYCWYGNEIILKSENICFSIYSSDWYRNTLKYKNNLLIVMTRAQEPISLYAGNLFTLSLVTFVAILKSSWSYFAVLRTVSSDE